MKSWIVKKKCCYWHIQWYRFLSVKLIISRIRKSIKLSNTLHTDRKILNTENIIFYQDTIEISRSRKSKDRQYNEKQKKTNNDLHNITRETKDRAKRIPLKPAVNSGAPEGKTVPAPHVAPVILFLLQINSSKKQNSNQVVQYTVYWQKKFFHTENVIF